VKSTFTLPSQNDPMVFYQAFPNVLIAASLPGILFRLRKQVVCDHSGHQLMWPAPITCRSLTLLLRPSSSPGAEDLQAVRTSDGQHWSWRNPSFQHSSPWAVGGCNQSYKQNKHGVWLH